MPITSPTRPVLTALLAAFRAASHGDLAASPSEVVTLIDLFAILWPAALVNIEVSPSTSVNEITTTLQPAGRTSFADPLSATAAMRADMLTLQALPSMTLMTPEAEREAALAVRRRYGNIAACGHGVLRVIDLLAERHLSDNDLATLVGPFLPSLAPLLTATRPSTKA